MDESDVNRWTETARSAHRKLVGDLDHALRVGGLEVTAPSLLPDWSVGQVITHITQSGEGHLRMLDAADRGEVGLQYPGGRTQRTAGIAAGAARPGAVQLADLSRVCGDLESRWSTMSTWDGCGDSMGGLVPVADLVFLRIRETAIHHVDLGIGYSFADLPPRYVREELRRMEMLWSARQPMGMTPLPAAALARTPPDRLAWLMGRGAIEGLSPANVF